MKPEFVDSKSASIQDETQLLFRLGTECTLLQNAFDRLPTRQQLDLAHRGLPEIA
jgi:hypothetical protein